MTSIRLTPIRRGLCKGLGLLAILMLFFAVPPQLQAQTLTVSQTTTDKKFVPQGNKIAMIYIKLLSSNGDTTFTSMRLKNASSQVFFGQHVTRAILFKDSINSQQTVFDDGQEEEIARIDFTTPTTADQTFGSFSQTIPSGNTQGYFVVYEISDTAPLSATTNLQLLDIGSGFNFGVHTITNTATITGFAVKNITSIAPSVVIPGQEKVGFLKLQLKMQGEGTDNGFVVKIANQGANFVGNFSDEKGITAAYLYKPVLDVTDTFDPNFIDNYTLAQSVIAGQFTAASEVTFSFAGSGSFALPDGVTKNFFVVYDIGEEMQVTTETKVYAQVTSLSAKGTNSLVSINMNTAAPQPAAESLVAGLSFSNLLNIVPANVNFGQLSQIPMFQFQIQANHATINVNSVILQNPGNVPFITSVQDLKNVQSITLFEDTNRDGVFNGTSVGLDTQIGSLQLGTGTNQQDRAVITVSAPDTGDLIVSPFDSAKDKTVGYNQNNARRLFAVYTTGRSIQANPSSTTAPFSVAQLENVVGSTNIGGTDFVLSLSGTLPASANPEAIVNYQTLSLRLDSVTDISPETTVRGQTKVPMLAFTVEASTSITSANITILNGGNSTFNKFHQGVSKVWLYRDENNNRELDASDTLLTVNDTLPDTDAATLSGISMPTGFNHFLVLYDIGFLAPLTEINSTNISRAEFNTIQTTGSSIIFGGQSLEFAEVRILEHPIRVTNIVSDPLTNGSYYTSTFNVRITLENTSTQDISITQFYPRIYQSSNLGGTNISSEFTTILAESSQFVLPAGQNDTYTFVTKHTMPITGGTARLDAYVGYNVGDDGEAVLTRYLSQGGWVGASPINPQISLQGSTQYAWSFPAYVNSVSVASSGSSYTFANNDALPAGSSFSIIFQNTQNLDENSIIVSLNGVSLQKAASLSSLRNTRLTTNTSTYSYDSTTGTITISDIGTTSGQIVLQVTDNDGNALPNAVFDFQISADIKISEVLFFPNPYLRSTTNPLRLGFNITQPATVTIQLYNNLGVQVYNETQFFNTLGYNSVLIDANEDFMASGMYLCRIYAEDISGKKSSGQTRLAVY